MSSGLALTDKLTPPESLQQSDSCESSISREMRLSSVPCLCPCLTPITVTLNTVILWACTSFWVMMWCCVPGQFLPCVRACVCACASQWRVSIETRKLRWCWQCVTDSGTLLSCDRITHLSGLELCFHAELKRRQSNILQEKAQADIRPSSSV